MSEVTIKRLSIINLPALQEISHRTFSETFGPDNNVEDLDKYLNEFLSKEKLVSELNNPNSAFYFATLHDNVIGYLKLNFGEAQTELKDQNSVEIERIYVIKEYHGKKIAPVLFEEAKKIANSRKADFIWLGVWEHNQRAIAFYKKQGLVEFDKHLFMLGNDPQTDIMMKLQLGQIPDV